MNMATESKAFNEMIAYMLKQMDELKARRPVIEDDGSITFRPEGTNQPVQKPASYREEQYWIAQAKRLGIVACPYCGQVRQINIKPCEHCGGPSPIKPGK